MSILYGIGVGPGDPDLITVKGLKILQSSDVVFEVAGPNSRISVSASVLDAHKIGCRRVRLEFSMDRSRAVREKACRANAGIVAAELDKNLKCSFVSLGDPMTYSTFVNLLKPLLEMRPGTRVEVVPGVTSYQAAAARARMPLAEDTETVLILPSLEGQDLDALLACGADTVVFLKAYKTCGRVAELIRSRNPSAEVLYASRLGLDGERLSSDLGSFADLPDEYLSLIIAKGMRGGKRNDK